MKQKCNVQFDRTQPPPSTPLIQITEISTLPSVRSYMLPQRVECCFKSHQTVFPLNKDVGMVCEHLKNSGSQRLYSARQRFVIKLITRLALSSNIRVKSYRQFIQPSSQACCYDRERSQLRPMPGAYGGIFGPIYQNTYIYFRFHSKERCIYRLKERGEG